MISNYFKIAFRNLSKHKVSTSINILGLTIGISVCLVIFMITDFELTHDTFHPDSERIYRVVGTRVLDGKQDELAYMPAPLSLQLGQQVSGLDKVAGFFNYYAKVSIPETAKTSLHFAAADREKSSPVIIAQPDYFSVFQYAWLAGNKNTALSEPFKVVLSDKQAEKYFGNDPADQLLGREIILNDSLHLTVSGIVKTWDKNTDFGFSHFVSFATVKNSFLKNEMDLNNWGSWDFYSQVFVKLPKNTNPQSLKPQLAAFVNNNFRLNTNITVSLDLQPLADIHFNSAYTDAYSRKASRPVLYGLMVIAAFILVIATINYINLSTVQTARRAKETGIRKVLGSSRKSLIFQFLGETAMLTFFAFILSLLLLAPVLYVFGPFLPDGLTLNLSVFDIALFFAILFIFILLTAGLYPAVVLSKPLPVQSLKGNFTGKARGYYRTGLVIFQFTVSIVFIIATLVVSKQIHYLMNKDMGFKKEAIINLKIPSAKNDLSAKKLLMEKLQQYPGIVQVSLHRDTPLSARHGQTSIRRTAGNTTEILAAFEFADHNYLPLYEIKLLAGQNLSVSDTLKEFLINVTCARLLGFKSPANAIGQTVEVGIGGKKGAIAGVVADFHSQSLHETIQPFFLTSNGQASRTISIRLTPGAADTEKNLQKIQSQWAQLYPDEAFAYRFFDVTFATFYEAEQKMAKLVNTAMLIAIFISCIGLYGISAFIIQQRTKEIGIRKVLGASVSQIASLVSLGFIKSALIALLLASPVAWYYTKQWLQKYPYQTSISWWIFPAAGFIAIIITLITTGYQSVKAAMTNPVKTLKTE